MIKFILSFVIIISVHAYGQDTKFSISEKGDILWQDIIESDTPIDSLLFNIKKSGQFSNVDTLSSSIIGEVKKTAFDLSFVKSSIWKSDIPGYMVLHDYVAFFEINFKPGKYRILVKEIKCIGKVDNPKDNMFITKPYEEHPLNYFAFKNKRNEFNNSFVKYSIPILEKNFLKLFSFRSSKDSN